MLKPVSIPGLFITGTDTGVGKTLIASAIAHWFRKNRARVGVCKPIASGCVKRREGLVSEDAELLAHHAGTLFPLEMICPQRFLEPLAPAIAAERAGQPIDWPIIDRSIQTIAASSDVMIVEGVGGLMVPLDNKYLILDMIKWLRLPTLIVARPGLGTINHTLMTAAILRSANLSIAGVVINRYPPETPPTAEETNPRAIEKWGRLPILCLVPDLPIASPAHLPPDILAAIDPVDWTAKARGE